MESKHPPTEIYDAYYDPIQKTYVDNLDMYYTKTKSPFLYCKCNEENTTHVIYVDKAKFKAHTTTKKHKMWLKTRTPPPQTSPNPNNHDVAVPITQTEDLPIDINPIVTEEETHAFAQEEHNPVTTDIIQPRYYAPKVSHLIYFMKWTVRTEKIMREIEERIILKT